MPFLVISPWAKGNYVDHGTTDQTSSLAFIEYNWGLGFIDGVSPPPAGAASFDRAAGSTGSRIGKRSFLMTRPGRSSNVTVRTITVTGITSPADPAISGPRCRRLESTAGPPASNRGDSTGIEAPG
jgi:hypothetical protein